jgi:hypothetical protein
MRQTLATLLAAAASIAAGLALLATQAAQVRAVTTDEAAGSLILALLLTWMSASFALRPRRRA